MCSSDLEKDVLRLLKKNKYALNDKIDQPPVVIANNIKNIGFAYLYFDPDTNVLKEKDSWQGTDGFPVAVRITLTTLRNASKTYSRTVYLPIVKKNES